MRILNSNSLTSTHARRLPSAVFWVWAICACLIANPAVFAHQQKMRSPEFCSMRIPGNIEVMHRFFIHDAEHAAGVIFGERQTLAESSESRQLFSSYVMNRFSVEVTYSDGSREELALNYVGEEIDGQFLWVYQEIPVVENVASMTIVNMALRDVWSDQSNLVNIERDDRIYSLTFDGARELLSIELGA
jgi:hypothetical protein